MLNIGIGCSGSGVMSVLLKLVAETSTTATTPACHARAIRWQRGHERLRSHGPVPYPPRRSCGILSSEFPARTRRHPT